MPVTLERDTMPVTLERERHNASYTRERHNASYTTETHNVIGRIANGFPPSKQIYPQFLMNADISAKTSDDKHALDKNSLPLCTASVGGDDYGIPPLVDVLFDPFYDSRLCVQIIDRDVKEALQMHSGYSILGNHGNSSD